MNNKKMMLQLISKFTRNLSENGFARTLKITCEYIGGLVYHQYIRERLPVKGYAEFSGVEVPEEIAPKRRLGERSILSWWSQEKPVYKGYLGYLRKYACSGDDVTIIGGGRGVSSVVAAQKVGTEGKVTTYEGSPEMLELVDRVTKLNAVRDRCILRSTVVGPAIDVYTDDRNVSSISPKELDNCDVLLLDCEGAEYDILPELDIRPQYILAELHPNKVEYQADEILEAVPEYDLIETAKYYGEPVSEIQFRNLLECRKRGKPDANDSYVKNPICVLKSNE